MTESLADGLPVSPAVSFILKGGLGGARIKGSLFTWPTNKQPDERRQVAAAQKGSSSFDGGMFSAPVA